MNNMPYTHSKTWTDTHYKYLQLTFSVSQSVADIRQYCTERGYTVTHEVTGQYGQITITARKPLQRP